MDLLRNAILLLAAGTVSAETCTYDGAWDNVPANAEDEVVVVSGALTWTASMPATVKSWTQSGGTVTFNTVFGDAGFTEFTITGDATLSGGSWTHPSNLKKTYRLNVAVGGDLMVGADAKITAQEKGYAAAGNAERGPGGGSGTFTGAVYGGKAENNSSAMYGSVCCPEDLGSRGNRQASGGAIKIVVGGTLTIDGDVNADSSYSMNGNYASSTGGSVWLTAGAIVGSGRIAAEGGYASHEGASSGGRISLVQTGAVTDFSGFTGKVSAAGTRYRQSDSSTPGDARGPAGTIYYETAADGRGGGKVVVDGQGMSLSAGSYWTGYSLSGCCEHFHPRAIEVKGKGCLHIPAAAGDGAREVVLKDGVALYDNATLYVEKNITLDVRGASVAGFGSMSTSRNLTLAAGTTFLTDCDFSWTNLTVALASSDVTWQAQKLFIATNAGLTVSKANTLNVGDLTLGTGATMTDNAPLTLTGDLTVQSGGKITHSANGNAETYKADITVAGDMTVAAGGSVDVSEKGYDQGSGPGCGYNYVGSSHGGRGMNGVSTMSSGACYGSIRRPTTMGSSNTGRGGGAVKLTVGGAFTCNGSVSAHGYPGDGNHSAPGGSIWITAKSIAGASTGMIEANGGGAKTRAYQNNRSGGGRVAVWLTDANSDFSNYAGTIFALGASNGNTGRTSPAGAGTVYLKTGSQAEDEGTLIVDNFSSSGSGSVGYTEISSQVLDTEVGDVIIRRGGALVLLAGQTLTVKGSMTNACQFKSAPTAQVLMAGDAEATLKGGFSFGKFTCKTPGKVLKFQSGKTIAIQNGGSFAIEGADGRPITLASTEAGAKWNLNVDGGAGQAVSGVDVSDSDASAGAQVVAMNSTVDDFSLGSNWKVVNVRPGDTLTWSGASGTTSFASPANWDAGRAPLATDRIVVPAGCEVYPAFVADVEAMDFTVAAGASVAMDGFNLTVTNLDVKGTLDPKGGETIEVRGNCLFDSFTCKTSTLVLSGTEDQTFAAGGCEFYRVRFAHAATLAVNGGFSATFLEGVPTAAATCVFEAGKTVTVGNKLTLTGAGGAPSFELKSSEPGNQWNLAVQALSAISGVKVSDSAATGNPLTASGSADAGGNSGWTFGEKSEIAWTGFGGDGDFANGANWAGGKAPGEGDDAVIAQGTVKLTSAARVGSLTLGGAGAVSFTATAPLDIVGCLVVADGATATLNRKTTVGASLVMESGATITHGTNPSGCANFIDLEVAGNLIVPANAKISADAKGYCSGNAGPGAQSNASGGHASRPQVGQGAAWSTTTCGYGSIFSPTNFGSAAANASEEKGGGAIRIVVGGTAYVDGTISANGQPAPTVTYFSGAGGSVWLTLGRLLGTGTICANSGDYRVFTPGSGGRVALHLTSPGARSSDFAGGRIEAHSGVRPTDPNPYPYGSCGTVYVREPDEAFDAGTVILDSGANGAEYGDGNCRIDYPVLRRCDPQEGRRAAWVLKNDCNLNLTGDAKVRDISVVGTKARIYLNGHALRIMSKPHEICPNASQIVPGGTADAPGKIFWKPSGVRLIVK